MIYFGVLCTQCIMWIGCAYVNTHSEKAMETTVRIYSYNDADPKFNLGHDGVYYHYRIKKNAEFAKRKIHKDKVSIKTGYSEATMWMKETTYTTITEFRLPRNYVIYSI